MNDMEYGKCGLIGTRMASCYKCFAPMYIVVMGAYLVSIKKGM